MISKSSSEMLFAVNQLLKSFYDKKIHDVLVAGVACFGKLLHLTNNNILSEYIQEAIPVFFTSLTIHVKVIGTFERIHITLCLEEDTFYTSRKYILKSEKFLNFKI